MFETIVNFFKQLFANIIKFGIQGGILVGISYSFKFLTGWVTGGLVQMLLQVLIMGLSLYFMDKILKFILPNNSGLVDKVTGSKGTVEQSKLVILTPHMHTPTSPGGILIPEGILVSDDIPIDPTDSSADMESKKSLEVTDVIEGLSVPQVNFYGDF